jgi:hypothetical protein
MALAENSSPSSASVDGLTEQNTCLPSRFILTSPAWLSSLRWCESVDEAILSCSSNSPTQQLIASSVLHAVPGSQQPVNRLNICSRFGLDRALNITEYRLTFIFL